MSDHPTTMPETLRDSKRCQMGSIVDIVFKAIFPGIVTGRLQREKILEYSQCKSLFKKNRLGCIEATNLGRLKYETGFHSARKL
jgi:hypothetical protein